MNGNLTPITLPPMIPVAPMPPIPTKVRIHDDPQETQRLTQYIDSLLPFVVVEVIYKANLFNDANKVSTMRKLLVKELTSRYFILPEDPSQYLSSIIEELKHPKQTKVSKMIKTPEQAESYERHKLLCRNRYRIQHGLPLLDGPVPVDYTFTVDENGTPLQAQGTISIPLPFPLSKIEPIQLPTVLS